MKIYYALYDPSSFVDGDYWTWSPPEVKSLLHHFYDDDASEHLPPEPNELQDSDLWAGMVRLADWTVAYRYFNGGRDEHRRPGRYIMLTAWIQADDAHEKDLLPLFDNATFKHVAENAKTIPVPPPCTLEEFWTADKIPTAPFRDGETSFSDLTQAMQAFAGIPSQRETKFAIADIKIIRTAKEQKIVLNVVPETKSQPDSKPCDQKPTNEPMPAPSAPDNRKINILAILLFFIFAGFVFLVKKDQSENPKWKTGNASNEIIIDIPPTSSATNEQQSASSSASQSIHPIFNLVFADDCSWNYECMGIACRATGNHTVNTVVPVLNTGNTAGKVRIIVAVGATKTFTDTYLRPGESNTVRVVVKPDSHNYKDKDVSVKLTLP